MSEVATTPGSRNPRRHRVLSWLAWLVVALVCLLVSVAYHLRLPRARLVIRELLSNWVSAELRGELEIGEIARLDLDRIVARNVIVRDPEGRLVIRAEEVTLWPSWNDLLRGRVRTQGARIEHGEVRLFVSEDGNSVSLVDAFQPSRTSTTSDGPASPIPIVIDGVRLSRIEVRGDVPGLAGLDIVDIEARGNMLFDETIVFRVDHLDGRMVGPYPGETIIDHGVVTFDTNPEEGLHAYARIHRGQDRVRARIAVHRPEGALDDGPQHMNLEVHADHLALATLAKLGVPLTDDLTGTVWGDAQLIGPTDDLALNAWLLHDAGAIDVSGRISDQSAIHLEVDTRDFALHALVPAAPPSSIGGQLRLELARDPESVERARFEVTMLPSETLGLALPGFTAIGAITEDAVVIERVLAPHLGGTIEGHAQVSFDGRTEAHARIDIGDLAGDPNIARLAPDLHGAARGTFALETGPAGENLRLHTDLQLRDARLGNLRARMLRLRGRARGGRDAPIVDAELEGHDVVAGETALGAVTASVHGGPSLYRLSWRSRGADVRQLEIDADVEHGADQWIVHGAPFVLDVGLGPMRSMTRDVRLENDVLTFSSIKLEGQGQRFSLSGSVHLAGGDNRLIAEVEGFDLAQLHSWLEEPSLARLSGLLDGRLEFEGTLRDPLFSLAGEVHDLSFDRIRDADLRYEFHLENGVLDTHLRGDFGTRGTLAIEGPITVPSVATWMNLDRFTEEAEFALHVHGGHLNLAFIVPLLGERVQALGLSGRIGGELRLYGTLAEPRIERSVIILDRFTLPGVSELRAKIGFDLREGQLHIAPLWVADEIGELAMIEARAPLSLETPPTDIASFTRALSHSPWSVAVRIAPRLLDTWPHPLDEHLPPGVRGALTLTASGGDGEPTRGTLSGTFAWVDAPIRDTPCAASLRPLVQVTGMLHHGVARVDASGFVAERRVVFARADAPTPIDDWFRTGSLSIPEPDVLVQLLELPLEHVPWTCNRARGVVTAELMVGGLLGAHPEFDARMQIDGLRVASREDPDLQATSPHDVLTELHVRGDATSRAEGCMIIARQGRLATPFTECSTSALPMDTESIIRASVPLEFTPGSPLPQIRTVDPMSLAMLMSDAHLEPLLALIPQLANADVVADGRIAANGNLDELQLSGGLELRDGRARVVSIGQQLVDIRGALRLSDQSIFISDEHPLFARDGDGSLSIDGEIGMRGFLPNYAYLDVRPDEFPVRREGAVLAFISGVGDTRLSIDVDGLEGTVETSQLTVRLPEQMAGTVQPLEAHPDVLVVGTEAAELASTAGARYPIHLRVNASSPFWVRRNDFEIQVTAELDVRYLDPNLMVGGYARLPRGHFEVFGKRFEVQRGSLTFDAREELDPVVDLMAVYELPGSPGSNVSVTAGGRMSDLRIEFSSTETTDQGEIIALLVSGPRRVGEADPSTTQVATQQAARVVTGVAAGILTLGLRQQFGDLVPLIAIETGANLGDTRFRAGFNVDAIIPDFLREIVLGAYVEGFLTTRAGNQTSTQGGVGAGVTIELQFPFDLVGSGTYVPPTTWGFDLLWEPL